MQQPHEPFFSFSVPPKPDSNPHPPPDPHSHSHSEPYPNHHHQPAPIPIQVPIQIPAQSHAQSAAHLLSPILTNLDEHHHLNQIPFNPVIDHHHDLVASSTSRPHTAGPFAFNVPPSSSTSSDSAVLRSPNLSSTNSSIPTPSLDRPFTSQAFASLHPNNNSSHPCYLPRPQNSFDHQHALKPPPRPSFSPNTKIISNTTPNYPNHARPMTAPDAPWGQSLNDYQYASSSAPFAHQLVSDSLPNVPEADAPCASRVAHSSPARSPPLTRDHLGLHFSSGPERDPTSGPDTHSPTQGDPSSDSTAGSPDSSEPSPYTPAQPDQLRPSTHAGTLAAFAPDSRLPGVQPRPNTGHPNLLALNNPHTYAPPPMLVHQYRQPIFSGHHPHQFFGPPPPGHYGPSIGGPPHQERLYNFNILPGAPRKRARRRFDEVERLYECNYPGCTKAYGTLNHLNAHITMQKHGPKRLPQEFKEIRKEWRARKKAEAEARTGVMHAHQPMGGYAMVGPPLGEVGRPVTGATSAGSSPANSVVLRPAAGPFSAPPNAQAFAIAGGGSQRDQGDWYGGGSEMHMAGQGHGQGRFGAGGGPEGGMARQEYPAVERYHHSPNGCPARSSLDGRSLNPGAHYYEHHHHGQHHHQHEQHRPENHHHDGFHHYSPQGLGEVEERQRENGGHHHTLHHHHELEQ